VQNCIGQFYLFCKKFFLFFGSACSTVPHQFQNPETLLVWIRPGLLEINCSSSSVRGMVRLLGVHHRNVTAALSRRSPMCESGASLWRLSVRKTRSDDLLPSIWNLVVQWWVEETWVSPLTMLKWPERVNLGTFDERPTHFLMETHVYLCLQIRWLWTLSWRLLFKKIGNSSKGSVLCPL